MKKLFLLLFICLMSIVSARAQIEEAYSSDGIYRMTHSYKVDGATVTGYPSGYYVLETKMDTLEHPLPPGVRLIETGIELYKRYYDPVTESYYNNEYYISTSSSGICTMSFDFNPALCTGGWEFYYFAHYSDGSEEGYWVHYDAP